ncbi:hypothetical protein E4U41_004057 [Claviceps citrina]|nr:hypothetical protein E4U41_004057 [Claviceps citrina]
MRFIAEKTNIPVPKLYGCFEDDDAIYLITEKVEGERLADLTPEQRKAVEPEIEGYLETLRSLKSDIWGGPSGIVVPPYRVMAKIKRMQWEMKPRASKDLVFCHNDLSAQNIIVDPETLKIKAIIDWEYAGFYPREFEGMYFRRPGPSAAIGDEHDDAADLVNIMCENETRNS